MSIHYRSVESTTYLVFACVACVIFISLHCCSRFYGCGLVDDDVAYFSACFEDFGVDRLETL